MSKPVIIALYYIPEQISNFEKLHKTYNVVDYRLSSIENFKNDMQQEPYCNAVAIYGSYPGFLPLGFLDRTLIDFLPKKLQVIGLSSVGYDKIDLDYLKEKNIKLCNYPIDKSVAMDVADTALWHVLSGIRKFTSWDRFSRSCQDNKNITQTSNIRTKIRNEFVDNNESGFAFGHRFHGGTIHRPSEMKATILGFGLIGKEVMERLLVLGMKVNVVVRNKEKHINNIPTGVDLFTNDDLSCSVQDSNVLVNCLPGGPETLDIINEDILSRMSANSILVNIGRGSSIDLEDLKKAIDKGIISHVGLDVFKNEPLIENDWIDESNINKTTNPFFTSSITPHIGSSTEETFFNSSYKNIENIMKGLETGEFSNVVNA